MLSGLQEILVIVAILLAILFIPRMMAPKRRIEKKPLRPLHKIRNLNVRWRLGVAASALWLLGAAVYCRPWQGTVEMYLFYGVGPVVIGWCATWVISGIRVGGKD